MDKTKITSNAKKLDRDTESMSTKDVQILIACINAEARIEAAKLMADAINSQGRNITNGMIEIARSLNKIAKYH